MSVFLCSSMRKKPQAFLLFDWLASFKACVHYFINFLFFHQMIALQKL